MGKKSVQLIISCLIFIATVSILHAHFAQQVLKTDMKDPNQVVGTRKFLMQAVKGNMIDLNKKLKAGNIKDISVNGTNIAAIAAVMPPLFMDAHKKSYPFKGSKTYYKSAEPAAFESASEKMRAAGMAIREAAEKGDQTGVKSGLEALKSSCGGCHSAFRGKY